MASGKGDGWVGGAEKSNLLPLLLGEQGKGCCLISLCSLCGDCFFTGKKRRSAGGPQRSRRIELG